MTRTWFRCFLIFALGVAAPAQDGRADLAIRKIVLYKHGVGYFEREGAVTGDVTIPLAFKSAQMKDVLKSLYAVDLDGGQVLEILYDSKDPVQKQLEDILFEVPESHALTKFMMQLKGAAVRVAIGERRIEGRILGIEPVQQRTESGVATTHRLVLLRDDGAIENLELLDAGQIELLDESVRQDLARMMEIYAKARYADRKTVRLRVAGQGQHRVRVGYIIETPIWKTSYRLLLDAATPPLLQGWAIVENRTDEDWTDVQLTFVAGSPMSFVLDLYTSYYPERPVLDPGIGAAAAGVPVATAAPTMRKAGRRRGRLAADEASPGPAGPATAGPSAPAPSLGQLVSNSVATAAQGVEVGDLFAYEAKGTVTIKKGQAALVPILLEGLAESKRVLYYRRDVSPHPSHAMRLVNSTSLSLEKGPVTVFEGSTCLGESMLARTLKDGMHELLPYALETGVEVTSSGAGRDLPLTRGVLAAGILTLWRKQQRETRYTLRNKTKKAFDTYLDHPRTAGFELVEPATPDEVVGDTLRFHLQLDAEKQKDFLVREEREQESRVSLVNESLDRVRFFSSQAFFDDATRAFLTQLVGWMEERATLDREIAARDAQRAKHVADQDNLRKNLGVLRQSPEERTLRDRYLARLTAAMEAVDRLDGELAGLRNRREAVEKRLRAELQRYRPPGK